MFSTRAVVVLTALCVFLGFIGLILQSIAAGTMLPKLSHVAVAVTAMGGANALNITYHQTNTTLAPDPLPPPGSSSYGEEIIRQFGELGRTTGWKLVQKTRFHGNTFEPEGIVRVGPNRFFVSAGEYTAPTEKYNATINGTDRTAGAGFGHMIVFDGAGNLIADASVTQAGSIEYHNGGIDYDGTYIWATFAQYRPNTTATLVKMDPATLEPQSLLRIADHMGGAVHDMAANTVLTLDWGSRNASIWGLTYKPYTPPAFTPPVASIRNPSYYTDYQDCKFLGHSVRYDFRPVMLCSGITALYGTNIGGIALVDMLSMIPLAEVPLTMVSDAGNLVTKNPMDVAVVDGKMRLFFLPDDFNSTLYVYEAS